VLYGVGTSVRFQGHTARALWCRGHLRHVRRERIATSSRRPVTHHICSLPAFEPFGLLPHAPKEFREGHRFRESFHVTSVDEDPPSIATRLVSRKDE